MEKTRFPTTYYCFVNLGSFNNQINLSATEIIFELENTPNSDTALAIIAPHYDVQSNECDVTIISKNGSPREDHVLSILSLDGDRTSFNRSALPINKQPTNKQVQTGKTNGRSRFKIMKCITTALVLAFSLFLYRNRV